MVRLQGVMPMAAGLTISGLAGAGGVGVETIRYYQRRGLLAEPRRPHGSGMAGGIRRYGAEDVRRLRFIRSAQAAGFTLGEIAELLALDAGQDRQRARELATARIEAIDAEIAKLQQAREALRRMAGACASTQEGPCPILTAFDG
ncbi:transcriptional regulator, MerR family [Rhizorhabdus wittichii RW1]|uniref:Transcriptional regulator, MerR family n=2 Tax=Rhizorhabdus wittichii TaxID=160791 RepID=A0A9J9LCW3_RHIWR|nr:transcriptional regulator, MerR family [Rhizorhabdus wittichii RW1]